MRQITDHIVDPVNEKIEINVLDQPGQGGTNHNYGLTWPNGTTVIEFQWFGFQASVCFPVVVLEFPGE